MFVALPSDQMIHIVHVMKKGQVVAERHFRNQVGAHRWIEIFEETSKTGTLTAVYVGEFEGEYDDATMLQWGKQ